MHTVGCVCTLAGDEPDGELQHPLATVICTCLVQAVLSIVVTETESLMTWSRLEGLLLHWAVSRKAPPAERWELPPRGWKTLPESTVDAGAHLVRLHSGCAAAAAWERLG
jgi:hypothetical protein